MSAPYVPLTLGTPRPHSAAREQRPNASHATFAAPPTNEAWREGAAQGQIDYVRRPEAEVLDELIAAAACADGGQFAPATVRVVLGEPGSGKSTLLRAWVRRRARALIEPVLGRPTPIYLRLRECTAADLALPDDAFADALWARGVRTTTRLLEEDAAGTPTRGVLTVSAPAPDVGGVPTGSVLRSLAARGRLVCPVWLLDGLDEVRDVNVAEPFLERLATLPGLVVVSCRTAVFQSLQPAVRATRFAAPERTYDVLGLTEPEQIAFLAAVRGAPTAEARALRRALPAGLQLLAGNPLLLTLLANVAPDAARVPASRAAFYQAIVRRLWQEKLTDVPRERLRALSACRDSYLTTFAGHLDLHTVEGRLTDLPDEPPHAAAGTPSLFSALERSGVLQTDDSREAVWFLHLTLHEYYLAQAWAAARTFRAALEERWADVRAEDTLALFASGLVAAGRAEDAFAGVRWLVDHARDAWRTDPAALLAQGRSPMRTALHLLGLSGAPSDGAAATHYDELWAAIMDTPGRRLACAADRLTPSVWLARLARDASADVRLAVAVNPGAPAGALAGLATDSDERVRDVVAHRDETEDERFRRMLAQMAQQVAARRSATEEGETFDQRVASVFSARPPLDVSAVPRLVDDGPQERRRMAGDVSASPEDLTRLAADPDTTVRRAIASNPATPPDVLARLTRDHGLGVSDRAMANPRTPEAALVALARDTDGYAIFMQTTLANITRSEAVLAVFASDANTSMRATVARNRSMPPELLARLGADAEPDVRAAVAASAGTPTDVLARLAADPDPAVRRAAALNPAVPLESLV